MAVLVVGGDARGAGKTALVCGVISALRDFAWVGVKVTAHAHADASPGVNSPGYDSPVWEELAAGWGSDTARYLEAGARRAFLLAARDAELGERLNELHALVGPEANLIFESNRVLRYLRADLCLAIEPCEGEAGKPSFALVEKAKDATVRRCAHDGGEGFLRGARPVFELEDFERISAPMRQWLREGLSRLGPGRSQA
jgi:hypothetical protein